MFGMLGFEEIPTGCAVYTVALDFSAAAPTSMPLRATVCYKSCDLRRRRGSVAQPRSGLPNCPAAHAAAGPGSSNYPPRSFRRENTNLPRKAPTAHLRSPRSNRSADRPNSLESQPNLLQTPRVRPPSAS